jgi:hypothetical protein
MWRYLRLDLASWEHAGNTPTRAPNRGSEDDLATGGSEIGARERIAGPSGRERRFGAGELQERGAPAS